MIRLYSSLAAIPFRQLRQAQAVTCLLCDIEGTLAAWGASDVPATTVNSLTNARSSGIEQLGLVTNIGPKNKQRVRAIAQQIHADCYFLPSTISERKPSPTLLIQAMQSLDITADHVLFIGDKLVDVIAAKRAGIEHIAWIDRLGTTDHIFDHLFYRPIEPLAKYLLSLTTKNKGYHRGRKNSNSR